MIIGSNSMAPETKYEGVMGLGIAEPKLMLVSCRI
jgi:hypothetical protein